MPQSLALFLTFLIVLGVPSSNLQTFDGLPFSRLPEFIALAATLPFVIFPALRQAQADFLSRLKIRTAHLWIVLAALFLLKAALFASGARAGFAGCYRSPAEPTSITYEPLPPADCERSYENLFGRFGATRLDDTIRFEPEDWNLVFLNTTRYNYYDWEEGNILRNRIPIEARWSGVPDLPPGDPVRIEYVGEGSVVWGDSRASLPPAYSEPNVVVIAAPSTESALWIDYSFDDGSRSGQDPDGWGPRASIRVSSAHNPAEVVRAQAVGGGWRVPAAAADGLILLWILACLPALWRSVRVDIVGLFAFSAGIALFSLIPAPPVLRGIGLTIVLAAVLAAHLLVRPFRGTSLYFIAGAAGFAVLRVWSSGVGHVLLRSAGNDPLSYESQAYSILATASLRGGEAVFFNVPAYRYVKFLEHVLFGDGNLLSGGVLLALFFGGVFRLFRGMGSGGKGARRKILPAALGCGLAFAGGYYVSAIVREGLSEYGAWILLLWAVPAVFDLSSGAEILAGAAALSVAFTIRPNLLPGVLWLFFLTAVRGWRTHAKAIVLAGALAAGIAVLPLAHNLYYGNEWFFTTNSAGHAVNLVLPPSAWMDFLRGDPAAAELVSEQIRMLFLVADVPRAMLPVLAVLGFFLLFWLALTVYSIARRRIADLPWLALPVILLSVHVFYVVNTYYPRHIFTGYLMMAAVSVLLLCRNQATVPGTVLARAGTEPRRGDGPPSAVESPRQ